MTIFQLNGGLNSAQISDKKKNYTHEWNSKIKENLTSRLNKRKLAEQVQILLLCLSPIKSVRNLETYGKNSKK